MPPESLVKSLLASPRLCDGDRTTAPWTGLSRAASAPGLGSPRRLIMRRRRPLLELKVVEIKGYSKKDGATSLRVSDNHGLVEVTAPDLKRCALHPCRAEPRVRKR